MFCIFALDGKHIKLWLELSKANFNYIAYEPT